jgi:hypothetical protein
MNFQGVRQRGLAIGVAVLILLLWYGVLGFGAIGGRPQSAVGDSSGSHPSIELSHIPAHLLEGTTGLSAVDAPGLTVHAGELTDLSAFPRALLNDDGAPGGPGHTFEPGRFAPFFLADLSALGRDAGYGPATALFFHRLDGTGFPAGPGGGGPGGGGPRGDDGGSDAVVCPMMRPASPQLFNALVAAGCDWDEEESSGPPATPPGLVDHPDDPGPGGSNEPEDKPAVPGPGGGSTPASVPEPRTWMLVGVAMALISVRRRRAAAARRSAPVSSEA